MCELNEVYGTVIDVEPPFQILTMLASQSQKPVNKYAALRVMNKIAGHQPKLVGICQTELESLITDTNRSVASLAISTLLKTCNEESVQKLLKQISSYLPDLGIDFKIEIIQSTQLLYQRIPQKASTLLKFLTDCLKEDGNIRFRESVVDTIMTICPSQRESALLILAEHIEDCEHPHIQTKIISFLAQEGPKASNPSTYIRFIYNRVNLERAMIRAAAVSALAAFANGVPSLTRSILHLLKRCLDDSDDEVRERAFFYIVLIENDMKETVLEDDPMLQNEGDEINELRDFVFDQETNINVDALEAYLVANKDELCEQEDEINVDTRKMIVYGVQKPATSDIPGSGASTAKTVAASTPDQSVSHADSSLSSSASLAGQLGGAGSSAYFQELKNEEALQPILTSQRHLFSSEAQNLTENDAEYVIKGVKHFFDTVIVVQYEIQNTLEDQILSEVQVKISKLESAHGLKLKGIVPLHEEDQIKYNEKRFAYIILSKADG